MICHKDSGAENLERKIFKNCDACMSLEVMGGGFSRIAVKDMASKSESQSTKRMTARVREKETEVWRMLGI